jgi:hypothetical protein
VSLGQTRRAHTPDAARIDAQAISSGLEAPLTSSQMHMRTALDHPTVWIAGERSKGAWHG